MIDIRSYFNTSIERKEISYMAGGTTYTISKNFSNDVLLNGRVVDVDSLKIRESTFGLGLTCALLPQEGENIAGVASLTVDRNAQAIAAILAMPNAIAKLVERGMPRQAVSLIKATVPYDSQEGLFYAADVDIALTPNIPPDHARTWLTESNPRPSANCALAGIISTGYANEFYTSDGYGYQQSDGFAAVPPWAFRQHAEPQGGKTESATPTPARPSWIQKLGAYLLGLYS